MTHTEEIIRKINKQMLSDSIAQYQQEKNYLWLIIKFIIIGLAILGATTLYNLLTL